MDDGAFDTLATGFFFWLQLRDFGMFGMFHIMPDMRVLGSDARTYRHPSFISLISVNRHIIIIKHQTITNYGEHFYNTGLESSQHHLVPDSQEEAYLVIMQLSGKQLQVPSRQELTSTDHLCWCSFGRKPSSPRAGRKRIYELTRPWLRRNGFLRSLMSVSVASSVMASTHPRRETTLRSAVMKMKRIKIEK
jgi:hypothetical protein